MNKKLISRKELLQLTFFKLLKQGKQQAALCLSDKLIFAENRGSDYVNFEDKEVELEIIRFIDEFLENKHFSDICNLNRYGHFQFDITGKDVIINVENYEKS
ncbi:MAG: hypothetical protein ACK5MH_00415 [Bacteroidales bacterium]